MPPPAQRQRPDSSSLEEHEPLLVLGSGVTTTGRRLRTPGSDPKAVVERWMPRVLTPLPARCPSTDRGGLYFCACHLDPVATGSRGRDKEVQRKSLMLRPRGARGRGGSAGVKRSLLLGCARVMEAHSSGILFAGRRQRVFSRDSVLFPEAFGRIHYNG